MQPFSLSQNALAKSLNVTPRRIDEIVNCKRAITVDTKEYEINITAGKMVAPHLKK